MADRHSGCMICGSPLKYSDTGIMRECILCGKTSMTRAVCENGHFVCDLCHEKSSVSSVKDKCLGLKSKNPVEIFLFLVSSPDVHMHGPEHHIITGASLLTAIHNSGEEFDLSSALDEMVDRGKQTPGGMCGYWGCCGAAVSCGMAISILTECTPLSEEAWGLSNTVVSRCLGELGRIGGPRCCKRDSMLSLITAAKFLEESFGVELELPEKVRCSYSSENRQCLKERCPFHSGTA